MRFSVALCTYNGAKYLPEQLESIAAQTLPPWELVACDDGSQDGTVRILEDFAGHAPFPVRVHVNSRTLRSTKNFEKAISLCGGEVIALSDQDDVWLPCKLERLAAALAATPKAGLVFTDAEIVDENLRPLHSRLWSHTRFTPEKQRKMRTGNAFDVQLALNVVTGATMAFRADLKELVLPIPDDIAVIHDGWIALLTAAVADLLFLEDPLILYRQHSAQQMGVREGAAAPRVLPRSHYEAHQHQLRAVCDRLRRYAERTGNSAAVAQIPRLEAWIRHLQARLDLPRAKPLRLPTVFRELATLRYFRYSNGWNSVARDFLF